VEEPIGRRQDRLPHEDNVEMNLDICSRRQEADRLISRDTEDNLSNGVILP